MFPTHLLIYCIVLHRLPHTDFPFLDLRVLLSLTQDSAPVSELHVVIYSDTVDGGLVSCPPVKPTKKSRTTI